MAEEKVPEQVDAKERVDAQPGAPAEAARRIPGTSVAVMIFILLVAFFCVGLQVVTDMVEAKNAPEVIKGKDVPADYAEYPIPAHLPEGVAASVNGVEIPESQITSFIMGMRASLGLESQEAWDEWMIDSANSTETIRNRVIMYYVNNELIDQMADELGIKPTEEDYQKTRDLAYGTPESKQALEESLAREGRTLDDYEADVVTLTKRRLIGEVYNEGIVDDPAFRGAVLKAIQSEYPEYAEAMSLDEVDPELAQEKLDEYKTLSDMQAFSGYLKDFVERGEVLYSKMGSDLPYQSNSDTYFMKEQFKQMLNKNGIFLGEGGVLDGLVADEDQSDES